MDHSRCQQVRGAHPLRPVRRCPLLAPHPRPVLRYPVGQAGTGSSAGRRALALHQPDARRGRRRALPASHWRHDLRDGGQGLLQPGPVPTPLPVQGLPDGGRVRLPVLSKLPPVDHLRGMQEEPRRTNCHLTTLNQVVMRDGRGASTAR